MKVYFAELLHNGVGRSPNTVPLAAGYLASYAKKYVPEIEVAIFQDAEKLLQAVRENPPAFVGFTSRLWSDRLSAFCAERIKKISPKTVTSAGGQSIDDLDPELLTFIKANPWYDVVIPSEGEVSVVRLLEHLREHGELLPDTAIGGCGRLSTNGELIRGEYVKPEMTDIPSPYLNGLMDPFLAQGSDPLVQTMRGCPYSCTFCVSGTSLWSKLRPFDLDRVFAEFEYVKKKSKSDFLILTDENFGVLRERDVTIAEYIYNSYKKDAYPGRVYYYTAKIVTEHVMKVAETLAEIGEFGISFQSMDRDVVKEIKRVNVKYDRFLECIQWAREKNVVMSTEMIFGFPGETVEGYLEGLEQLLRSGIDRIYSYNLKLFPGIDLKTACSQEKYEFKTKFRLPERTFGVYENEVVTEVEEIVIGSNSFDYKDYQTVRKYGLFLEVCSGRGYFAELMRLMISLGLPGEKLVTFLAEHEFEAYPNLQRVAKEYLQRAQDEFFDTAEECEAYVKDLVKAGKPVPEVKLNFIFMGKIIFDSGAREELFEVVKDFVRSHAMTLKQTELFIDYLDNILSKRIVSFHPSEAELVHSQTRVRLDKLERNDYTTAEDLMLREPIAIDYKLHKDTSAFIKRKPLHSAEDEATIQDVYMKVFRFGLKRVYEIKAGLDAEEEAVSYRYYLT